MRTLYVIPARSSSSRLPGKNRLVLGGRSMLERTVDHIGRDYEIMVNTRDEILLREAERLGVMTHVRHESQDAADATVWQSIDGSIPSRYGAVCVVHLNVVGRPDGLARALVRELYDDRYAMAIPVEKIDARWHPYYVMDESARWLFPGLSLTLTQELPSMYVSSLAGVYAARSRWVPLLARDGMQAVSDPKFSMIKTLVIPTGQAIEIDTEEDLWLATSSVESGEASRIATPT